MCWVVARFCGLVFVVVSLACVCCNDRQYRPDQRRVRAKIVWFDGLFGFGCFWVFGVGCWFWLCFVFVFVVLFGCVAFLLQGMSPTNPSDHQGLPWESSEVTFHFSDRQHHSDRHGVSTKLVENRFDYHME